MFQQDLQPVGDSLALSALCGALPLLALFVLLGGLRMKAWLAGVISLVVALLVAVAFFEMPVEPDQASLHGHDDEADDEHHMRDEDRHESELEDGRRVQEQREQRRAEVESSRDG